MAKNPQADLQMLCTMVISPVYVNPLGVIY
jgi:hypothetical protein